MDKALEAKLIERFPVFFVDMYGDPTKTCMHWGCTCGNGWYDLIYKTCEQIEALGPPEDFKFAQVKEKFGGLRIYTESGNQDIGRLIGAAETESYKTCEECGTKEGVTVEGAWIRSLCGGCRNARRKTNE